MTSSREEDVGDLINWPHLTQFRATITNYYRQHGLNNKIFPTVLKAGKSRTKCWQVWCLMRTLSLVYKWPPSPCIVLWEREEASSLVTLLIRAQILSNRFHPHDLITFKGPIFKSIILGIRVSGYEFGGTHTVSSLQALYCSFPLKFRLASVVTAKLLIMALLIKECMGLDNKLYGPSRYRREVII